MNRFELIFISLVALCLGVIMLIGGLAFAISDFYSLPLKALAIFKASPLFFGSLLALFGLLLLTCFYTLNKKRFLYFRTEDYSISEKVLKALAEKSLRSRFPDASCDLLVRKGVIEVIAQNIDPLEEELHAMEELLTKTFFDVCGYTKTVKVQLCLK
ncbi:MAG: hypothetical protein S4CHLAM81_06460 [Chlamydiales bacterium]|nr:hypothetical protein [Chlamydiales bacterium]MCH9635430.1 hypothetical protein [Chlamydiales bacterium]MCH9703443.1 hypothetical protein [Chlamydiota bacterium]